MQTNKGDYKNLVVMGLTRTSNGRHYTSLPFDEKIAGDLENIAKEIRSELKAGRKAGKFFVRERSESSIATGRSKATHFLEFVPASEVQAYEAANPRQREITSGI